MKRVLVFAMFACTIDRHVTLLLGPDDTTLTTGFTCDDPNGSGLPLLAEAWSGSNDMLTFQLVVDVIDVGEHVPSCLGEDIEAACADGACQLSVADAPMRFCQTVTVGPITQLAGAPQQVIDKLQQEFPTVIAQAPNRPVIVRAVATSEGCAELGSATGGVWPALDSTMALGCAYSCPLNLNDADGIVSLGLNVAVAGSDAMMCTAAVRACARFPEM
jgi:hypothetical protein